MSSRALTIAREDFRHVLRDRLLWGAFVLVFLLMVPTFWQSFGGQVHTTREQITHLPVNFRMYVVVLVAVLALKAVVGERESGTMRLLLGLPGTRQDVVLGKLLSRLSMLVLVLAPIFVVLEGILLLRFGSLYLGTFVPTAAWMLLYGTAWTAFTIGVSAAFSSWYRTLAAVAVTYLSFSSLVDIWNTFVLGPAAWLFTGQFSLNNVSSLGTGTEPTWLAYVGRLNPIATFVVQRHWLVAVVDPSAPVENALPNLFGVVVIVLFGVVPCYLGWRRFEQADLE